MVSPVYLIFGEDEYSVSTKAKEIVDAALPPADRTLGLEVIDGATETVDAACQAAGRCFEALQTVGFLGGAKAVWFRDVSFLADTVVGRSEAVKAGVEKLTGLVERGLSQGTTFVVSAPKVDKRFAFYKACKAKAQIHEFALADKPWQAEKQTRERVIELLREAGLGMDEDALDAFMGKVGADGRQIANELEKLAVSAAPGKQVKLRDVLELTSSSRSALAWDIADALGKRELGSALEVLRRLMFQRESPIGLVILLHGRIRELMLYREALDKGWLRERNGYRGSTFEWVALSPEAETKYAGELNKDPRTTHPFRVGLLAGQSKLFSPKELRMCQKAVVDAHRKLVSSRVPPAVVLELLVIQMLKDVGLTHSGRG